MKKTSLSKKKTKTPKVVWTEAEDFFLQKRVMDFSDAQLAEKLNKTESQVVKRLKELNIDVESLVKEAKRSKALAGLAVGSANNPKNNIVSMTGGRSMADDIHAKTSPYTKKEAKQEGLVEPETPRSPNDNERSTTKLYDKFKTDHS